MSLIKMTVELTLTPLSVNIVILNLFYQPIKSMLLGTKKVFKHQYLQMLGPKLNKLI